MRRFYESWNESVQWSPEASNKPYEVSYLTLRFEEIQITDESPIEQLADSNQMESMDEILN